MKKNIGIYEPEKKILIFIDQKPYLSGPLIKNYFSFYPFAKSSLQQSMIEKGNDIGSVHTYKNLVFLIVRKHFNSKINVEQFKSILFNLPANEIYKTTKESFTDYAKVIENLKNDLPYIVQFYDVSGFNNGIYETYEGVPIKEVITRYERK